MYTMYINMWSLSQKGFSRMASNILNWGGQASVNMQEMALTVKFRGVTLGVK